MKCKHCSKTWKLSGGDGPIGNAAPGHFMIVFSVLAVIALVLGVAFKSIGGIAIGGIATFILIMALVGCGYKDKNGPYQGSECPACSERSRIMPWDF